MKTHPMNPFVRMGAALLAVLFATTPMRVAAEENTPLVVVVIAEGQGETIDALRREILEISDAKFLSEQRVQTLERENERLVKRVDELATEVEAYKVLLNKSGD